MHWASLYLFTRGFLLSRDTLPNLNECDLRLPSCSLAATHSKLVFLVVDALRSDFVLPVPATDPAMSTFFHNHLTLPAKLTDTRPRHSFLSHFIADAPTTTVQRLQGLTTGSLPTFVEMGSNFGGTAIREDNWLAQARRHGRRIAFAGDDTWIGAFPDAHNASSVWESGLTFPFESFNVEDLDTVDIGVRHHLLDLLSSSRSQEWDILVAHTLGLDHAGHRFGPSHHQTTRKLVEANILLEQVVQLLDDDTLFVLIGDHGMTDSGDHGGESREELDAALWVYSKGRPLTSPEWETEPLLQELRAIEADSLSDQFASAWSAKGLPETSRSVSQVDLVSTLALLLGLPIPFGSLGLPVPELFYRPSRLPSAHSSRPAPPANKTLFGRSGPTTQDDVLTPLQTVLQAHLLVASQLATYLDALPAASNPFKPFLPSLSFSLSLAQSAYKGTFVPSLPGPEREARERIATLKLRTYAAKTRKYARDVWAKFDSTWIAIALSLWLGSVLAGWKLWSAAERGSGSRFLIGQGVEGALVAGWAMIGLRLMGALPFFTFRSSIAITVAGLEGGILFGSSTSLSLNRSSILPLLFHAAIFASNSFIVFEDRIVFFLLASRIFVSLLSSLSAPTRDLRNRWAGCALATLTAVRLMAISTICREEQLPRCVPTFGLHNPWAFVGLSFATSWFLPTLIRRFLARSKSDQALAPFYLSALLRPTLLASSTYWAVDEVIASYTVVPTSLVVFKTHLARSVLLAVPLIGTVVWYNAPLCLAVHKNERRSQETGQVISTQVHFIGFANTFGSSYTLFLSIIFAVLYLVNGPAGQIVIALQLVALGCLLECWDAERDVQQLRREVSSLSSLDEFLARSDDAGDVSSASSTVHDGPTFDQISTLALLSHLAFFATGHQAVLSSIQWSIAFVGFPKVVYPFSPFLVILNTLSSHIVTAVALPLFVFHLQAPALAQQPPSLVLRGLLKTTAGFLAYYATVGVSSALWAAVFRRHLMVWKVFAPRFMLSALNIVGVEVAVLVLALSWGVTLTVSKVKAMLGTKFAE